MSHKYRGYEFLGCSKGQDGETNISSGVKDNYELCVDFSQIGLATDVLDSSGIYERVHSNVSDTIFKRKEVNFLFRLIPSSVYDLDISVDCVEETIPGTSILLRAPKPTRLIHAFLYAQQRRGLAEVEYLFMHNSSWGEELLQELNEKDASAVAPILKNRSDQLAKEDGRFLLGKWAHVTEKDRQRLRFAF